jgi:MoaA/NifB/PqqE/SkfB family radical SAM enzyme
MDRAAFTAASGAFPFKILKIKSLINNVLDNDRIIPVHLQLNPTNRCNLKCSFCSCSERDKKLELSLEQIELILKRFASLGCKAVTVTGGGEPLLHDIGSIVELSLKYGIELGLVTNGLLLNNVPDDAINKMTWVRVSVSSESELNRLMSNVEAKVHCHTDWSFSYVITKNPSISAIIRVLELAEKWRFTHVRIVNDILHPVTDLAALRNHVLAKGVMDRLAIWQDRQRYSSGVKRCLISLLKPVIAADGRIYPCCGTQYAESTPSRDYGKGMVMGTLEEIDKIWFDQKHFDGSGCVKCYYDHYNSALSALVDPIKHAKFV